MDDNSVWTMRSEVLNILILDISLEANYSVADQRKSNILLTVLFQGKTSMPTDAA